ncbi:MAG TPA: hypothetical protein PKG71_02585 [Candidatus Woesebacteria bacterium]|nr:hypothetical protein [Candidatus Woesebacteria bacterium]HNS94831.1 hypothetical protein [Candidatus Woesebacteria bacterium]
MNIQTPGLALDIDDTLADTLELWIPMLLHDIGGPRHLTPREILKKYTHTRNVPEWQTKKAKEYITKLIHDNDLQVRMLPTNGSVEAINQITRIIPINAYITVRPESVMDGTSRWLKMYGFPEAPLIYRPSEVEHKNGTAWKSDLLTREQRLIKGIVDNDLQLPLSLSRTYKGSVFLYDAEKLPQHIVAPNVYACADWSSVVTQVERVFGSKRKAG